jgi:hypothetical protein
MGWGGGGDTVFADDYKGCADEFVFRGGAVLRDVGVQDGVELVRHGE